MPWPVIQPVGFCAKREAGFLICPLGVPLPLEGTPRRSRELLKAILLTGTLISYLKSMFSHSLLSHGSL